MEELTAFTRLLAQLKGDTKKRWERGKGKERYEKKRKKGK